MGHPKLEEAGDDDREAIAPECPSQTFTDSDSLMQAPPASAQENARNNIIRETVETERNYVQDLEHTQVRVPLDVSANYPP